ncbi:MAG: spore maturation protein A [Ruminococcaceae bacterium]|nr:spore maturation protein A [Oscillospiraceae bacterium]
MAMSYIWAALVSASLLFTMWTDRGAAVSAAGMNAAVEAVGLGLKLLGPIMLWSGIMELMRRSGLTEKLAALLSPLLLRLFPDAAGDDELLGDLSCNMSANLLGLGNAATPAGIRAACRLADGETADDALCRLVVLNTASLQLLPTTVAAVRASLGAAAPFDILPAVWVSSAVSVATGLLTAKLFSRWS